MSQPSPMLPTSLAGRGDIDWSSAFAHSLTRGRRCLVSKSDGSLVTIGMRASHFPKGVVKELLNGLPTGLWLDGQLDSDGAFRVSDCVLPDDYGERTQRLEQLCHDEAWQHTVPAEIVIIGCRDDLLFCHQQFVTSGYAGVVLRYGKSGYEPGSRSRFMLSVAATHCSMFRAVDVRPVGNGMRLICECDENPFEVLVPAGVEATARQHIGGKVLVEFFGYTTYAERVPRFPTLKGFKR